MVTSKRRFRLDVLRSQTLKCSLEFGIQGLIGRSDQRHLASAHDCFEGRHATFMSAAKTQFELIVGKYADDLYRYALWLCKDAPLASDLVQETYLRAWRSFDKLRDHNAAKSWLITILRREHARIYERKRLEMADIDEATIPEEILGGPDDSVEVRQLRKEIYNLDEKYRNPLLLQVLGGFSCEEIANELGVSRSAVMTQLFRAREKLKEQLHAEPEQDLAEPPNAAK